MKKANRTPGPWINSKLAGSGAAVSKRRGRDALRRAAVHPPKRLILAVNLLPWYDELEDRLQTWDSRFPPSALRKIKQFGSFEIEEIGQRRTILIRRPNPPSKEEEETAAPKETDSESPAAKGGEA